MLALERLVDHDRVGWLPVAGEPEDRFADLLVRHEEEPLRTDLRHGVHRALVDEQGAQDGLL